LCEDRNAQELSGTGEKEGARDVCLETEVTDPYEGAGKDMEEESADEGVGWQGERPAFVAVLSIAIGEGDVAVFEREDSFVADSDAMGVAAEVAEDLFGTSQGSLAVDDPILGCGLPEQPMAEEGSNSRRSPTKWLVEEIEEFSSEHLRENAHRDEKARACGDPGVASVVETTPSHDAVDVWVKQQCLRPGVEDGDGAGSGAESAVRHDVKGGKRCLEEQGVCPSSVGQEERMERQGHGEDDMEIGDREQVVLLGLHPASLFQALALWTMAIPAGIVERLLPPAVVAHLEVASQ
jgi:hypothetical protein